MCVSKKLVKSDLSLKQIAHSVLKHTCFSPVFDILYHLIDIWSNSRYVKKSFTWKD